jgi:hypothetical protein
MHFSLKGHAEVQIALPLQPEGHVIRKREAGGIHLDGKMMGGNIIKEIEGSFGPGKRKKGKGNLDAC